MAAPNFLALSRIEEQLMSAKLEAVRASIEHAGEKGRELELDVRALLRSILPAEYGLTTGFIVAHSDDGPRLSTQLDIIIYDAVRSAPLLRLNSCDVLPLEAVYGYVEVKASLNCYSGAEEATAASSLEQCIRQNVVLRAMKDRRYWQTIHGSPMSIELYRDTNWMSLRSYVIAFEAAGKIAQDVGKLAQYMANTLKRYGRAHLHGVLIPNVGLLYTRPVDVSKAEDDDYFHVRYTSDHPLLAFRSMLLQQLATFPRPPDTASPAVDQYMESARTWTECSPLLETDEAGK